MKRSMLSVLIATLACALMLAMPAGAFAEEAAPDTGANSDASAIVQNGDETLVDNMAGAGTAASGIDVLDDATHEEKAPAESADEDGADAGSGNTTDGDKADEPSATEKREGDTPAAQQESTNEEPAAADPTSENAENGMDAPNSELAVTAAAVTTTAAASAAGSTKATSETASSRTTTATAAQTVTVKAASVTTAASTNVNPAYTAGFRNGHKYVLTSGISGSRALTVSGSNVVSAALTRAADQLWKCVFTSDGYVTFISVANGLALDVAGANTKDGTNVGVYKSNGSKAQKWLLVKDGSAYRITSALSTKSRKLVLDVEGASTSNGANVQIYTANKTNAQAWKKADATAVRSKLDNLAKATAMPKGNYALASMLGSSLSLAVSGSNVVSGMYTGAAKQKWTVTIGKDGYATIKSSDGRVLDVAGAKAMNGANVQVYAANGTRAQKWIVLKNSNGSYTLQSALWSNFALDISGASKKSGTNVQLYSSNSTNAQRWDLRQTKPTVAASDPVADGWYVIWSSTAKKLCLDVSGAGTGNGTSIQLYAGNNTPAQRFHIVKSGNYYRIDACVVNGKRIDLDAGKVVPGTKAQIWNSTGNYSLFSFKKKSNGTYLITNVASGLTLGTSGNAKQGSAVQGRDSVLGGRIGFVLDKRAGLLDEGTYSIRTTLSGARAVSVVGGSWSPGAKLEMSSYTSDLDQKWHVYAVSGKKNTYYLENLGSGLRMSGASNSRAAQSSAKTTTQQWTVSANGSSYIIKNVATKKVLDVSGANTAEGVAVMNWDANGTAAQRWNVKRVADLDTGLYEFRLAAATSQALDEDTASGNVQVWSNSGAYNQRWYFDKKAGTLVNLATGKVLDVTGAGTASGTNVQSYEKNGTSAQKWKVVYTGAGRFKLVSSLKSTLVLSSAGKGDGSNATSSTDKSATTQRWRVKKCDIVVSDALKANVKGIDMSGVKGIGIDVSAWQGTINWLAVKNSGVDFAIIRVGHGTGISDSQLAANVQGCLKYGIPFGLYYYSTAKSVSAAKAEADHALNMMRAAGVTKSNITYAVYYDLEESSMASTSNRTLLANMTSAFLGKMKSNGYKTGVYANLNWWTNYLTDASFNNYDRWVAQWHVARTSHPGPYTFWQIHSEGSVPGISGRVDIDVRY